MEGDAFALAGLGGFNAHGAGFLAAARTHAWVPDIVTATTGQILVVADWLRGDDLRKSLVDPQRENNPLSQFETAFFGYPGVFRPAYAEALKRFWTLSSAKGGVFNLIADRMFPAQEYVSTRDDAFFAGIADTFNQHAIIDGHEIGIVFNTYDLTSGEGVLYGNDCARRLLPKDRVLPSIKSPPSPLKDAPDPEAEIRPITAQAVKAALWLLLYGFEGLPDGQMDGAYYRSCVVSELHQFSRVFVARPLAQGWRGRTPSNWFEVQDWQCEMWFSVGYRAEVDALKRINQLIRKGHLKSADFKEVKLYEIEPETPAGYFHYFVERDAVFDKAFEEADKLFATLEARSAGR